MSAALFLTMVFLTLLEDCWPTMTHQVLEEYNSLPTTQATNRVPQNC